jgi:hypothetical protein
MICVEYVPRMELALRRIVFVTISICNAACERQAHQYDANDDGTGKNEISYMEE